MKTKMHMREAGKIAEAYRNGPKGAELQEAVATAAEAAMAAMPMMDPVGVSHDHEGKVVDDYNALIDEAIIELLRKDKKEVSRSDSGSDYFGGQGHLLVTASMMDGFLCVSLGLNITHGIPLIKKEGLKQAV